MNGMNSGVMPGPLSCTTSSQPPSHFEEPHLHAAALRRELDGVAQQVPHDLLQAIRIAGDRRGVEIDEQLKANPLGVGRWLHGLGGGADDVAEIHGAERQPDLAGHDPLHVEDVRNELLLALCVADDGLDGGLVAFRRQPRILQHVRPAEDGVERRAQLVRERGEKLVLHAAGFFRLGAQAPRFFGLAMRGVEEPDVVEQKRRARGNGLDQRALVGGVRRSVAAAQRQRAEDAAAADQRAEHAATGAKPIDQRPAARGPRPAALRPPALRPPPSCAG